MFPDDRLEGRQVLGHGLLGTGLVAGGDAFRDAAVRTARLVEVDVRVSPARSLAARGPQGGAIVDTSRGRKTRLAITSRRGPCDSTSTAATALTAS